MTAAGTAESGRKNHSHEKIPIAPAALAVVIKGVPVSPPLPQAFSPCGKAWREAPGEAEIAQGQALCFLAGLARFRLERVYLRKNHSKSACNA
ncbi:MAG: hypothetical protein LBI87_12020 [Candidatus Accumulibacter sp.]|nr:hypothetical protein [Accumulibacter sp.]